MVSVHSGGLGVFGGGESAGERTALGVCLARQAFHSSRAAPSEGPAASPAPCSLGPPPPAPHPLQGMGKATPLGPSHRMFLLDVSMAQHFPSHCAALSPVVKWTPSPAPALGRRDFL